MKKLITAVLLCIACLAFVGCGGDAPDSLTAITERDLKLLNHDNDPYRYWSEEEPPYVVYHRGHCNQWNFDWVEVHHEKFRYYKEKSVGISITSEDYPTLMRDVNVTGLIVRFHYCKR